MRKAKRTTAAVSFAADVEVIVSAPVRSSPLEGPVSHSLLQPRRELSVPIPQYDMSNIGPAAVTIAPPAYVLFLFDDPLCVNPLSLSLVSAIPAPPGFTPIGLPGSLAMPLVVMDVLPGFPSTRIAGFVGHLGPLSLCRVQPVLNETVVVFRRRPFACQPSILRLCRFCLARSSSPPAAPVPELLIVPELLSC